MRTEELSYFEEKEFKANLKAYEEALAEERTPYMDAEELTDIAEYYMLKNREQDAIECIQLAASLHPDAVDPQVFLSRRELMRGDTEAARRIASQIKEQQDREVRFLWAEICIKEENPEQAYELMMHDLEEIEDDEPDFYLYDVAELFLDYGQHALAQRCTDKIKELYPNFERLQMLQAEVHFSAGQFDEAIALTDKILSDDAFNKSAWELMAESQIAQGKYAEAIEAADFLLAIDENNAQGLVVRGNCLFQLERYAEASDTYQRYLKEWPKDGVVLFNESLVLMNMGQTESAIKGFRKAIKALPPETLEFRQAYLNLCSALAADKKEEEAVELLLKLYKETQMLPNTDYCIMRGHICLENDHFYEAMQWFEDSVRKAEDRYTAELAVAVELIEHEYYELGIERLDMLLDSPMPEKEMHCYPYKAYALYFQKNNEAFHSCLQKALEYNPSLTEFLFSPIFPTLPPSEYGRV